MVHEKKIETAGYGNSKKCACATARDQALCLRATESSKSNYRYKERQEN